MSTIKLTKSQQGNTISFNEGDKILIELPENPTTGFKWELNYNSKFNVKESFISFDENSVGGGGVAHFELTPIGSLSNEKLIFYLKRPWETDVEDEFSIILKVD